MDFKVFVLITLSIACYVIAGGFLFRYLEFNQPTSTPDVIISHEIDSKTFDAAEFETIVRKILDKTSVKSYNLAMSLHNSTSLTVALKYDTKTKWDIYGSIFYAETLVTTIGYGHISPSTVAGRLVSCLYAIIGIPIFGLWVAAIAENIILAAKTFRKRISVKKKWHVHLLVVEVVIIGTIGLAVFIFAPAQLFSSMEGWQYSDGIYFSVITLATIGFGDLVAAANDTAPAWYRILLHVWFWLGLGWLSMVISLLLNIFRANAMTAMKKAENKVAQITTEITKKFIARKNVPQRRNSFSGERKVSVMLSKTATAVQIFDPKTNVARLISLKCDDNVDSVQRPQSPQSRGSRQISSFDSPRSPKWVLGGDLVVETSNKKPTLGTGASILLFPKSSQQPDSNDEIDVNFLVLQQLISESSPAPSAQLSPNINRNLAEEDHERRALYAISEEGSGAVTERLLSVSQQPRQTRRPVSQLLRIPSTMHQQESVQLKASNESFNVKGIDEVVVMTDNGIAESLADHLTVLRPRSHSID